MMKPLLLLLTIFSVQAVASAQTKTFHDFVARDINDHEQKMSDYKGKKILVVNVASECGNTPQYEVLQKLYHQYGPEKFVVIGFPANNFGEQEPGSNKEIKAFCDLHYHVTFPMMSKISVKGKDIDPIFAWLTQKKENGIMDAEVTWNFQKFMIDENGHFVGVVDPDTSPDCDKIINWLKQ
jgi:glutathione peroxidase